MQSRMLRSAAVVTITALAAAGCENLSPGENAAAFGGGAAVLAGSFARAAGMSTAESFAVGAATGAVVAATVYVISKHQATERQRKIAEERAQAAYARIAARHREEQRAEQHAITQRKHTQTTGGGTATASTGTTGTSTTGGATNAGAKTTTQTAQAKPVKPKPMPRYIAVETEKSANAAPQAKKSVMIWDTESHEVVGNDVYDVSKTPNVGSTAKFDTYTAEYVGSGS